MIEKAIAFIFILISLIMRPMYLSPESQMVIATIVVAIILFLDPISGLMLGTAALIYYYRYHTLLISDNSGKVLDLNKPLVTRYVTEENLRDAQNNIIGHDIPDYIGVKGIYGEPIYGAQGGKNKDIPISGIESFPI